jgi:hypothetical protein
MNEDTARYPEDDLIELGDYAATWDAEVAGAPASVDEDGVVTIGAA